MASKSGIDLASILASFVAWLIDRQALAAMFTVSVSIGNWQLAIGEWRMVHAASGTKNFVAKRIQVGHARHAQCSVWKTHGKLKAHKSSASCQCVVRLCMPRECRVESEGRQRVRERETRKSRV